MKARLGSYAASQMSPATGPMDDPVEETPAINIMIYTEGFRTVAILKHDALPELLKVVQQFREDEPEEPEPDCLDEDMQ